MPAACRAEIERDARSPGPHRTANLILVAVDGVRWQDVFGDAAELPNLRRLMARGVAIGAPDHGSPMFASGPEFISLPGYQELLGGRPTECTSNHCRAIDHPTLLDDAADFEPAAISSWERIERATAVDNSRIVLSAGRHHGETRDRLRVDDCASALLDEAARAPARPGRVDYRADRYTSLLALEYVVKRRPRALFIGLGDTDEYGHAHDRAAYLRALSEVDGFIGALFTALDSLGDYGAETTVMITTDHGWSDDLDDHGGFAPESGRVFLLAAGGSIPARGLVDARTRHHLADVAPTARALLQLPPDRDPRAGRPIAELLQ